MRPSRKSGWVKVSQREPCAVCKQPDWCGRTADGMVAHCYRVESGKKAQKEGWIHFLSDPLPALPDRPQPKKMPLEKMAAIATRAHANGGAMRASLAKELGVSAESLDALGVGRWYDDYRDVFCSLWPERNEQGVVTGISRRYQQQVKTAQGEVVGKLSMRGSTPGIYYAANWRDYPGPAYIVEGGSDTAALLTIGCCVIGRSSNVGGMELIESLLRGEDRAIVVVGERDDKPDRKGSLSCRGGSCRACNVCWPGMYGALRVSRYLRSKLRPKKGVFVVLPSAKDARAWLMENPGATPEAWRRSLYVDKRK